MANEDRGMLGGFFINKQDPMQVAPLLLASTPGLSALTDKLHKLVAKVTPVII
jgi:hypothetical protein